MGIKSALEIALVTVVTMFALNTLASMSTTLHSVIKPASTGTTSGG